MKTITRKSMLYQTGVEYGDYAMNHVEGCSHGCKYPCYAYLQKKRFGAVKSYEDWCEPKLVSNTIELLEKELTPQKIKKIKNVQLCFTTDPFQGDYSAIGCMSLEAVEKINDKGIPVTVLTKGILPTPFLDFREGYDDGIVLYIYKDGQSQDRTPETSLGHLCLERKSLHPDNYYGISLVSLDEDFRKKWEPGSAPYADRIASLKSLHYAGCKTWVSVEPYPTFLINGETKAGCVGNPEHYDLYLRELNQFTQLYDQIRFVDRIVFGGWNYSKNNTPDRPFLKELADLLESFCGEHNIECIIKEGTVV